MGQWMWSSSTKPCEGRCPRPSVSREQDLVALLIQAGAGDLKALIAANERWTQLPPHAGPLPWLPLCLQLQLLHPLPCSVPGPGPSSLCLRFRSLLCLKITDVASPIGTNLTYKKRKWYCTLGGNSFVQNEMRCAGASVVILDVNTEGRASGGNQGAWLRGSHYCRHGQSVCICHGPCLPGPLQREGRFLT